ncbi:hypothetical protein CKO27_13575 [Thiocystis violacea]|nr:hypothetical protein [Thiocystis violacea]
MKIRVRLHRTTGLEPTPNAFEREAGPMPTDPAAMDRDSPTSDTLSASQVAVSPTPPSPSAEPWARHRSGVGMGLIAILVAGGGWLLWPRSEPAPVARSPDALAFTGRAAVPPAASVPVAGDTAGSSIADPPSLTCGERKPDATLDGRPRDALVEELERCRAGQARSSASFPEGAPARVADKSADRPKPAKRAVSAKKKAVRAKRSKAKPKAARQTRKAASIPFWAGRQGGVFLAD